MVTVKSSSDTKLWSCLFLPSVPTGRMPLIRLTVTCHLTNANLFPLEVDADMDMQNFLTLCQFEIPGLIDIPISQLSILHGGRMTDMNPDNLKKTINDLQIHDNDVLILTANKPTTSSARTQNTNTLITDLVKSIKVPQTGSRQGTTDQPAFSGLKGHEISQLRIIFEDLKNNSKHRDQLRGLMPDLVAAAEHNNLAFEVLNGSLLRLGHGLWRHICGKLIENPQLLFYDTADMFIAKFVAEQKRAFSRERTMLDPLSSEGQRLIAEQIQRENIDFSHQFAMEHMPEAYIPVTMLYIKMKINGIEVKAFVDSGAQVSILSDEITQRCNLMHLVDKRFQATVHGVGGMQTLLGKIHACQVQIEGQFFQCNFDVLANRDVDVLLGLDILKRHRCVIDLRSFCLRFGESATTQFLPDSEVPQKSLERLEAANSSNANIEVDSAKLASLMALGFEETAARAMLMQCGNDIEAAASNLLAKQSAPS